MIEKALFLFTAIFVLGGCSFLFFITTLFTASGSKSRKVSLSLFAASVVLFISTSVYTIYKVKHKIEDAMEMPIITSSTQQPYESAQIELLKSYSPEAIRKTIPESFYTHFGFRDWYRYPLVYPYSLNCVDIREYGVIHNESNVKDIENNPNTARSTDVRGIIKFDFDDRYLVAQCLDQFSDSKDTSYVVFEFETENSSTYNSLDEFEQAVYQVGFSSDSLHTISEYEGLF